jgi:hypothetical protein
MKIPWTPGEDALVRQHYATLGPDALLAQLPGRSRNAVKARAHRLGVARRSHRKARIKNQPQMGTGVIDSLARRAARGLPLFSRRRTS